MFGDGKHSSRACGARSSTPGPDPEPPLDVPDKRSDLVGPEPTADWRIDRAAHYAALLLACTLWSFSRCVRGGAILIVVAGLGRRGRYRAGRAPRRTV